MVDNVEDGEFPQGPLLGKISVRFVDAECSGDTFVSVVVAVVAPRASTIVVRSAFIVDEYVVDP